MRLGGLCYFIVLYIYCTSFYWIFILFYILLQLYFRYILKGAHEQQIRKKKNGAETGGV